MKVMQCFWFYLSLTENWSYRLISNLPEVKNFIASRRIYKSSFYDANFKYFKYPFQVSLETPVGRWAVIKGKAMQYLRKVCPYSKFIEWSAASRGIQLLHSHFAFIGWQYQPIATKLGVPHVVSFYGFDYENKPFLEPIWNERYQELFKRADAFVCEGSNGAAILKRIGCPPDKIHLVKLGVNVEEIAFVRRAKPKNTLKLIQIASFYEKKGHIYTVRAFKIALKTCPNLELTFVGGGDDAIRQEIVHEVENENISDKVTFIEVMNYDTIHEFLSDYDVFIHPSLYTESMDCEGGAPIVLLDAQATGMPVISTLHCDIPDYVVQGETGKLSPEKDVEGISADIEKFYNMETNEYLKFSKAARAHIELNYNSRTNSTDLSTLYHKLLGECLDH